MTTALVSKEVKGRLITNRIIQLLCNYGLLSMRCGHIIFVSLLWILTILPVNAVGEESMSKPAAMPLDYLFKKADERNWKQGRPLIVSILTADDDTELTFLVKRIAEINMLVELEVLKIWEMKANANRTPSDRISDRADVLVIVGYKIFSERIGSFTFNIIDFLRKYSKRDINVLYQELIIPGDVCRLYTWRYENDEVDKFFFVINKEYPEPLLHECTVMSLLRIIGVFSKSKKTFGMRGNMSVANYISLFHDPAILDAMKALYRKNVPRGASREKTQGEIE